MKGVAKAKAERIRYYLNESQWRGLHLLCICTKRQEALRTCHRLPINMARVLERYDLVTIEIRGPDKLVRATPLGRHVHNAGRPKGMVWRWGKWRKA